MQIPDAVGRRRRVATMIRREIFRAQIRTP
jgi:hypothetical protein